MKQLGHNRLRLEDILPKTQLPPTTHQDQSRAQGQHSPQFPPQLIGLLKYREMPLEIGTEPLHPRSHGPVAQANMEH